MSTNLLYLSNGDTISIGSNTVVTAIQNSVSLVDMPISAGAPLDQKITKWPSGGVGVIKFTYGAGTAPHKLSFYATTNFFPALQSINITGPGDYYFPGNRKELASKLLSIKTDIDPGGTLDIHLLNTSGKKSGDKDAKVLGVMQGSLVSSEPGQLLILVSNGLAHAVAKGSISMGDELVSAPGGLVQTRAGATGCDRVGTALETGMDGQLIKIDVALQLV